VNRLFKTFRPAGFFLYHRLFNRLQKCTHYSRLYKRLQSVNGLWERQCANFFTARCYASAVLAMGLCLSVTSRCSIETAERIELQVFGTWASFHPSYTVLKGNSVVGGRGGSCPRQLPPGAAGEGGAKLPHQKYFATNEYRSEYDKLWRMSQKYLIATNFGYFLPRLLKHYLFCCTAFYFHAPCAPPQKKNIGRGRTSLVLFPGAENPSYATVSSSSCSSCCSGSGDRSANSVKSKTHSHGEKLCHNDNANNMLVLVF